MIENQMNLYGFWRCLIFPPQQEFLIYLMRSGVHHECVVAEAPEVQERPRACTAAELAACKLALDQAAPDAKAAQATKKAAAAAGKAVAAAKVDAKAQGRARPGPIGAVAGPAKRQKVAEGHPIPTMPKEGDRVSYMGASIVGQAHAFKINITASHNTRTHKDWHVVRVHGTNPSAAFQGCLAKVREMCGSSA